MVWTHVLVALAWILYGVLHSVFASLRVKDFFRKVLGKLYKHYRLAYNIFAAASLAGILLFQFSINSKDLFAPTIYTTIIGGFLVVLGLAIMLYCIRKYFVGLSGLKSLLHEPVYQELIISGVHRYVRHPLYLGTFIFIWGLFFIFPSISLLLSNTIITAYTLAALKFEEEKLIREFGEQYRTYQKTVPKLIPKF